MEEFIGYILFVIVGIITVLAQIVKQRQENADKTNRRVKPPPLPTNFAPADETAQVDRSQEAREAEWARKVEQARRIREDRERERQRERQRAKEREREERRIRAEQTRQNYSAPPVRSVDPPVVVIPIPELPVVAELLGTSPIVTPVSQSASTKTPTPPGVAMPAATPHAKALARVRELLSDQASLRAALMLREILDPPLSKRKRS